MAILLNVDGLSLEHLLLVALRSDAHVFLAKGADMVVDVGVLLIQVSNVSGESTLMMRSGLLTSCSARDTFWSFILWISADAEPSSAAAAKA